MAKTLTAKQQYKLKDEYLATHFKKVTPQEFYRDMFPLGWLERKGHPEDEKPNAVFATAFLKDKAAEESEKKKFKELLDVKVKEAYGEHVKSFEKQKLQPMPYDQFYKISVNDVRRELRKQHKPRYAKNQLLFDDLSGLDSILKTENAEFVVTSPVTYSGKNRKATNAYHLWGIAIDLDGVTITTLEDLHYQIQNKVLPAPTYLVNSGNGIHVYYLFEEPIPLYRYLYQPLNLLKKGLTEIVWNAYTSTIPTEKRQFQGIFQGFRCPGTQSKLGKRYPVTAYRVGRKGMLIDLNDYVADAYKVNYDELTHVTIDMAKEKWPEWHQRRIVEGMARGRWVFKRAFYDKWLQRVREGSFDGNRYWCVATIAINAIKCNIDYEEALNDALELVPYLNSLTKTEGNEFTEADVYDAFDFYEEGFVNYPVRAVRTHTKIKLPESNRKFRKQEIHLRRARAVQAADYPDGAWRNRDGRPKGSCNKNYPARDKVIAFRMSHPEGTKAECNRTTALDPKTIRKWWDAILYEENNVIELTPDEHKKLSWGLLKKN